MNKKLLNLIELSSKVRFYVPTTINTNQNTDTSAYIERVESFFSTWFGGATQFDALGCWNSPAVGLVKEKTIIVESFCSESALSANIEAVVDLAEAIKHELAQESVAIEVNNKLYLV